MKNSINLSSFTLDLFKNILTLHYEVVTRLGTEPITYDVKNTVNLTQRWIRALGVSLGKRDKNLLRRQLRLLSPITIDNLDTFVDDLEKTPPWAQTGSKSSDFCQKIPTFR